MRIWRRYARATCVLAAALVAGLTTAGEPHELLLKYEKGDVWRYKISAETAMEGDFGRLLPGGAKKAKDAKKALVTMEAVLVGLFGNTDEKGRTEVETRCERLKYGVRRGEDVSLTEFDAAKAEKNDEKAKALVRVLFGSSSKFGVSPRGVERFESDSPRAPSVAEVSLVLFPQFVLPERPVAAGDAWTATVDCGTAGGTVKVKYRWTLRSVEGGLARIAFETLDAVRGGDAAAAPARKTSCKGELTFDVKRGRFTAVSCEVVMVAGKWRSKTTCRAEEILKAGGTDGEAGATPEGAPPEEPPPALRLEKGAKWTRTIESAMRLVRGKESGRREAVIKSVKVSTLSVVASDDAGAEVEESIDKLTVSADYGPAGRREFDLEKARAEKKPDETTKKLLREYSGPRRFRITAAGSHAALPGMLFVLPGRSVKAGGEWTSTLALPLGEGMADLRVSVRYKATASDADSLRVEFSDAGADAAVKLAGSYRFAPKSGRIVEAAAVLIFDGEAKDREPLHLSVEVRMRQAAVEKPAKRPEKPAKKPEKPVEKPAKEPEKPTGDRGGGK